MQLPQGSYTTTRDAGALRRICSSPSSYAVGISSFRSINRADLAQKAAPSLQDFEGEWREIDCVDGRVAFVRVILIQIHQVLLSPTNSVGPAPRLLHYELSCAVVSQESPTTRCRRGDLILTTPPSQAATGVEWRDGVRIS